MPKLENWSIVTKYNPYLAPECMVYRLEGVVYDHPNPRHSNGKEIVTSEIMAATINNLIVTYSGSIYELGKVNPDYEKQYPDTFNKLINTLKKRMVKDE